MLGAFPLQDAVAQLTPPCDVSASIQLALDLASPGASLTVCPGIYAEQLVIRKNGITLQGLPGTTLEGAVLAGTRNAITIEDGVERFTLRGFEIRNYRNSTNANDTSSGIVSVGSSYGTFIANNNIHHNGFAGIVFANGMNPAWTIENNTIRNHTVANVFAQGARSLILHNNTLGGSAPHAAVLAATHSTIVSSNEFRGTGLTGLALTPHLKLARYPDLIEVHDNRFTGARAHGLWSAGATRLLVENNTVTNATSAITLGGEPTQTRLINNIAAPIYETRNVSGVLAAFDPANYQAMSIEVTPVCHGLGCLLTLVSGLWTRNAQAQAFAPPYPVDCGPNCTVQHIVSLLGVSAGVNLPPIPSRLPIGFLEALDACQGEDDACLRDALFDADDTSPQNGWSMTIGPGVSLRFIGAGTMLPTETQAWRFRESELSDTRDTIVICRLILEAPGGSSETEYRSCALAPRVFDFGLDVTWSESDYAQHASKWRLKLPTDEVHASFDHVHGLDATIFIQTGETHHAESPAPRSAAEPAVPTPQDPLRTDYAGTAVLRCIILPGGSTDLAAPHEDCQNPTLLRQAASPSFLWCHGSLDDLPLASRVDESVHVTLATELAAGLWEWSGTCAATTSPLTTNWTTLYNETDLEELAAAQARYYTADTPAEADAAAKEAEAVTVRAVGRHLALKIAGQGMPETPNLVVPVESEDFHVIQLDWESGEEANLRLEAIQSTDAVAEWRDIAIPALVGFEPVRLLMGVTYEELDGQLYGETFEVILEPEGQTIPPPLVARYGANVSAGIAGWPEENRDYQTSYDEDGRRVHAFSLLEAKTPSDVLLGRGLMDTGFPLGNATTMVLCASTLLTGNATGKETNFVSDPRLSVDDSPGCVTFEDLLPLNLTLFSDLVITVEIRKGGVEASVSLPEIILEALRGASVTSSPSLGGILGEPTLTTADFSKDIAAVNTGNVRLTVTLPDGGLEDVAVQLASVLKALAPTATIFAVEIEGLPLVPELALAVEGAVHEYGSIILTTAGSLPPAAWDLAPQDKLLTIHGLAASPWVITIGAGSEGSGVANWTRLGPTPSLTPKPDFVAPSVAGTTIGSVMNALPFAEALAVKGIRNPGLLRATLAGLAIPIESENGAAATYYEQGFGSLDLGAFLDWPDTGTAVHQLALALGETDADVQTRVVSVLGVPASALVDVAPGDILGAASNAEPLLRAALAKNLVNLVIDTPALPANLQADFGVVNHALPGIADFTPLDYDGILNESARSLDLLLREAAYSESDLDSIVDDTLDLIRIRAEAGQEVTLNVTHYEFFDLLRDDLLYTAYHGLLGVAYADHKGFLTNVTQSEVEAVQGLLESWLLDPKYLVDERSGTTTLNTTISSDCAKTVPVLGLLEMYGTVRDVLVAEALMLDRTTKGEAASGVVELVPPREQILTDYGAMFFQDQAGQLTCFNDQVSLIMDLQNWTREMHHIKSAPWGELNQTEAWLGTWNVTVLGGQINETATDLGIPPGSLASKNSTLVLDQVLAMLDRAYNLTVQKLSLVAMPQVTIHKAEGVTNLTTNPAKTSVANLGLYVGIARMTSRNITVYNPLSGEPILTRNVTVPLPSFLWNNPTLVMNITYRDGTPITDTTMRLDEARPRVFDQITLNFSVTHEGIKIPMHVSPGETLSVELAAVEERLEDLEALVHDAPWGTTPGLFNAYAPTRTHLEEQRERLEEWLETLQAANATPTNATTYAASVIGPALEGILQTLVSRSDEQWNVTNAAGESYFHNLFPGEYRLYEPYPYPMYTQLDHDLPHQRPGANGLAGPMVNIGFTLAKEAHNVTSGLVRHPTNTESVVEFDDFPSNGFPLGCLPTECDVYPIVEIEGDFHGPFHQFDLTIQGPDILGIVCKSLDDFTTLTETPVLFQGCKGAIRPPDSSAAARVAEQLLKCILDRPHATLSVDVEALCVDLKLDLKELAANCNDGNFVACVRSKDLHGWLDVLEAVTIDLGFGTESAEGILPYVHSPVRLAVADPAAFGFTPGALLEPTKNANPGVTKSDAEWLGVIEAALVDLDDLVRDAVGVNPPDRFDKEYLTQVQGILHHATDRVSGLDWVHFGVETNPAVDDSQDVLSLLEEIADMPVNIGERDVLQPLAAGRLNVDEANEFSMGIARTLAQKRERFLDGWRPNGTIAKEGLRLDGVAGTRQVTGEEACIEYARTEGLPPSYFDCHEVIQTTNLPELRGYGSVDKVRLANALLEELRTAPSPIPDEDYQRILRDASMMSVMPLHEEWRRSTDAVMMTDSKPTPATPPSLALGALIYETPLPTQEILQYRLSAEFYLKNTGALVITTVDPLIVADLLAGLETISAAEISDDLNSTVAQTGFAPAALLRVIDGLGTDVGKTPYFRIDTIGMPVGVEEVSHFGGVGLDKSCIVCGRGLLIGGADGYYAYNRTHEMNTRAQGGAEGIFTIVVYFPLVSNAVAQALGTPAIPGSDLVLQELLIKDFRVQTSSYIGKNREDNSGRFNQTFEDALQIGFHPRIEEWQMLYAVPDQVTGPEGTALNASFWIGDRRIYATDDDLVEGRDTHMVGDCPDSVAPGYPTRSFTKQPHFVPVGLDELYGSALNRCLTDAVEALKPKHVVLDAPLLANWTTTAPEKKPLDAVQYTTNVHGQLEDFTQFRVGDLGVACNVLCDPSNVGRNGLAPWLRAPEATGTIQTIKSGVTAGLAAATGGTFDALETWGLSIESAIPLLQPSFRLADQHSIRGHNVMGEPRHNFVRLDRDDAVYLLNGTVNPQTLLHMKDTSNPALAAQVHTPPTDRLHGMVMPSPMDTEYKPLVVAHFYGVGTAQIADKGENESSFAEVVFQEGQALAGNGAAGTGIALRVFLVEGVSLVEENTTSFLDGLQASAGATIIVDAYLLGGDRTAGSDCRRVPLAKYVQGYFRCVGYSASSIAIAMSPSAGSSCYGAARDFLNYTQGRAWEARSTYPEQALATLSPHGLVAQAILGGADSTNVTLLSVQTGLNRTLGDLRNETVTIANLAECLKVGGAGAFAGADLTAFFNAIEGATDDYINGDVQSGSFQARVALNATHPILTELGEPDRGVVATIQLDLAVPTTGAFTQAGPLGFRYAVEEWSTKVSRADLNLTVRRGTNETTIQLASTTPPPISQLGALPIAVSDAGLAFDGRYVYIVGGKGASGPVASMQRYDTLTDEAVLLTALPSACQSPGAAWVGSKVYIFGCVSQVLIYDIATDTYAYSSGPHTGIRLGAATIATPQGIFLFGGALPGGTSSTAIRLFHPVNNTLNIKQASLNQAPNHYMAAYYDGTHIYLVGGSTSAGPTNIIARYDPVTDTITRLSETLKGARTRAAIAYDPLLKMAYLFGGEHVGGVLTANITQYDPTLGQLRNVSLVLANATAGGAALWHEGRAIIFGGRDNNGPSDKVLTYAPIALIQPDSVAEARILRDHGENLTLRLEGVDEFGTAFEVNETFVTDILPPELTSTLLGTVYTNQALDATWSVWDNVTGIASVTVEKCLVSACVSTAWTPWTSASDPPPGGSSISITRSFTDVDARARVRVVDGAGNTFTTPSLWVRFDTTPPNLTGAFLNLTKAGILQLSVNSSAQASDGKAGLSSLTVRLLNLTPEIIYQNASLSGAAAHAIEILNVTPVVNTTYTLEVTAVDRAGNSNTSAVAVAKIRLPPKLNWISPARLYQNVTGGLAEIVTAIVPYLNDAPMEMYLNVSTPTGTSQEFSWTDESSVSEYWNTSGLPQVPHYGLFWARYHDAYAVLQPIFNLTQPSVVGNIQNLTEFKTYGVVNNSTTYNLYRLTQGAKCGGEATFYFESLNGAPVQMYIREGDPNLIPAPTDETLYTESRAPGESITLSSMRLVYSLLVKGGPPVDEDEGLWDITYETNGGCDIGGPLASGGGGSLDDRTEVKTEEPQLEFE